MNIMKLREFYIYDLCMFFGVVHSKGIINRAKFTKVVEQIDFPSALNTDI